MKVIQNPQELKPSQIFQLIVSSILFSIQETVQVLLKLFKESLKSVLVAQKKADISMIF